MIFILWLLRTWASINLDNPYPIFLRPRRFGKTLFADTLQTYYCLKEKENFEFLFGNTYIGSHKTTLANSYYVLHLNFSGLDTTSAERLEESFGNYVKAEIKYFMKYYELNNAELDDSKSFLSFTQDFLLMMKGYASEKLYIIIDEYDHFANALLSNKKDFERVTNKYGFVRSFYEIFKKHTNDVIGRIFITGVTSLTLDSLTSGFNIAENISLYPSVNEAVGFTHDEVKAYIEYMELPNSVDILNTFKKYYNGYLFSAVSQEWVFNSNMILYYVNYFKKIGQPHQLADPNITGDYSKLFSMFDIYKDDVEKERVLQRLMNQECISGKLVTSFSLIDDFSYDHFVSLLYYLGLVTIDSVAGEGKYLFKTPNKVIRDIYYDYYFAYLTNTFDISRVMINDALSALEDDADISPLVNIIEKILQDSTENNNRYMIHFRENTLQTLFYLIMRKSNQFNVVMEYKTEQGYVDILYSPIQGGVSYAIELKYLIQSKYDSNHVLLNQLIEKVTEQVEINHRILRQTEGIGIIFVGKVCKFVKRI